MPYLKRLLELHEISFMADNSNSYTYKRYKRSKAIFRLIGLILLCSEIFGIWYVSFILQNRSFSLVGLFISLLILSIYLKIIRSWERINKIDNTWNYNTWGRGAGAEWKVQKALDNLPTEYKVISDFNTGQGNIDFIIIGSKGIFTIEVKASKGFVQYLNGQLLINGKVPEEKNYIHQAWKEKDWLVKKLYEKFNRQYQVTALIEFPYGKRDKNSIHGPIDGVWIGEYTFHDYLIKMSANYLSSNEIETLYHYLKGLN